MFYYFFVCVSYFKNLGKVLKTGNVQVSVNVGEMGASIMSHLWLGWSGMGCHVWPLSRQEAHQASRAHGLSRRSRCGGACFPGRRSRCFLTDALSPGHRQCGSPCLPVGCQPWVSGHPPGSCASDHDIVLTICLTTSIQI